MTAVALANRLAEQKIQVRFLGVIDPSYPLKQLETKELCKAAEAPLQDNVQSAAVFYRSGRGDGVKEKALFGPTRIPKLDKNNKNTKFVRSYRDPRHPNLDHLGTGFSRAFGYDMWKAALAAKVPLPAIDESVFASKEKWSSKPHGGVLERIRENEQKQVEDYRRGGGMPFPIPKNEDGKPFGIPPDMQEDK